MDDTTNLAVDRQKGNLRKNKLNSPSGAGSKGEFEKTTRNKTFINLYTDADENSINYNPVQQTAAWICTVCSFKNRRSKPSCDMCNLTISGGTSKPRKLPLSQGELSHKHWTYITKYCKMYKLCFTDTTFPPTISSIYQNATNNQNDDIKWRRIRDVKVTSEEDKALIWTVFRQPSPCDIQQRSLSHCWLMSAMAILSLAENEHLLSSLFVTKEYRKEGAYQIRIFDKGQWKVLIVDDLFPCNRSGELIFAPGVRKQLWPLLLEKAAAKCHGYYSALNYGYLSEGFIMLTGAPCEEKYVADYENESDLLLALMSSAKEAGFSIGAMTHRKFNDETPIYGLEEAHIYSMFDVQISEARLLLRDPSGCISNIKTITDNKSDSSFWISFDHFMKMFVSITICKPRPEWCETRFEGDFLPLDTAQHCSYKLDVSETVEVDLMLYRHVERTYLMQKVNLLDIYMAIYKVKSRPHTLELVTDSYRWQKSYASCNAILQPGQYVIYPLSVTASKTNSPHYMLVIHSSREVTAKKHNQCSMRDALTTLTLTRGLQMEQTMDHVKIYCLKKHWQGVILMVENYHHSKWIRIQLTFNDDTNLVATRGNFETEDFIAPRHRQIVNVLTTVHYSSYQLHYTLTHRWMSQKEANGNIHLPKLQCAIHYPQIIK